MRFFGTPKFVYVPDNGVYPNDQTAHKEDRLRLDSSSMEPSVMISDKQATVQCHMVDDKSLGVISKFHN